MHLIKAYRYPTRKERATRKRGSIPIAACEGTGDMVSIYKHPEDEPLIDCLECLQWLGEGDNRLLVIPGGVEQWIMNHVKDREIRYIDIPME